jgi:hypothetical protein
MWNIAGTQVSDWHKSDTKRDTPDARRKVRLHRLWSLPGETKIAEGAGTPLDDIWKIEASQQDYCNSSRAASRTMEVPS